MKITKRQLRKLIREAGDWYSDRDETFADMKFRMDQEEDEALDTYLDDLEELQPDPRDRDDLPMRSGMRRRNESVVKFTKKQLLRIIREESNKISRDMYTESFDRVSEDLEIATDFIRDAMGTDENDYDGLVQYLSYHTGRSEAEAEAVVADLIDDDYIQYDSRNDEFYM